MNAGLLIVYKRTCSSNFHEGCTEWNKKFQILDWAKLHWFWMFLGRTICLHDGNLPWCAKMVFNLLLLRTISDDFESWIWWFINKFEKKYDFLWWLTPTCMDSALTRSLLVLECPKRKTMALSNSIIAACVLCSPLSVASLMIHAFPR